MRVIELEACKELYRLEDSLFNDAFDRAVVNIHLRKQESGSRTFVICGCEPEVGTTTIAINLAIAMASSGWNTVLIDADMRKAPDDKRLSDDARNLAGYLSGDTNAEDILCPTNHEHLYYIAGGKPDVSPIQLLSAARMDKIIDYLKKAFDYVIIDAPSLDSAVDSCILASHSDGVILVARWDHTTTHQIKATRDELEASGAAVMGILVNRMEKQSYSRTKNKNTHHGGRNRPPAPAADKTNQGVFVK